MGYEDREYMQDDRGGGNASIMPGYPTCRSLIIATAVLFLAQIFITRPSNPEDLRAFMENSGISQEDGPDEVMVFEQRLRLVSIPQQWLELDSAKVVAGQVWRLLTTAFLHDRFSPWHIVINLALLYWFGRRLEDKYGSREFLLFYLAAAVSRAPPMSPPNLLGRTNTRDWSLWRRNGGNLCLCDPASV